WRSRCSPAPCRSRTWPSPARRSTRRPGRRSSPAPCRSTRRSDLGRRPRFSPPSNRRSPCGRDRAGVPMDHRFLTTRWSLVLAAGQKRGDRSAEALASLCETYWYPVYAFIRRQGYGADEARDLTQEFFARVLEKNYFHDADPARGRFRAFLSAAIRHFLSNERGRARALKRGGKTAPVSLERGTADGPDS